MQFVAAFCASQVMKTYHMYHSESINAESKLKDAGKQIGRGDPVFSIRMEKKIEKMKEKVDQFSQS